MTRPTVGELKRTKKLLLRCSYGNRQARDVLTVVAESGGKSGVMAREVLKKMDEIARGEHDDRI